LIINKTEIIIRLQVLLNVGLSVKSFKAIPVTKQEVAHNK